MKSNVSAVCLLLIFLSASSTTSASTCDRDCLLEHAKDFNLNMLAHTSEKISLASNVQVRENTKAISLRDSRWSGLRKILSYAVYADPVKGNVIEHVTAETSAGKAVYIGTRLKLADGKVTEIEINFDDSPNVNVKNLVPYDPIFNTIVPTEERAYTGAVGAHHHFLFSGAHRP